MRTIQRMLMPEQLVTNSFGYGHTAKLHSRHFGYCQARDWTTVSVLVGRVSAT